MSIDPSIIVTCIKTCAKIYTYVKNVYGSAEQRHRFMQEVLALKEVFVHLQERLEHQALPQNHPSTAPLVMLFDANQPFIKLVQRDLTKLEETLRRGEVKDKPWWQLRVLWTKPVAAGIWPLDKADSNALLVRIERYKSLISLAMQDDIDQLVHEILRTAKDGKEILSDVTEAVADLARVIGVRLRDDERIKVAEWISKIDFGAYHAENSRKWLEGTGRWVLESSEFQNWVSRTSSPPILWCYGDAGAGKSVAAAMIVEHLRADRNRDNIVLVIVCRYNDQQYLRETHAFMCCLLRQLLQLESSSNVPPSLVDLHRKGIHPSEDCIRTLLIETAHIISRPIFIVLDALDECALRFDLVAAIQHLGSSFNLLITSRNVFAEIKDYPSLHIRAPDSDILALIDNKIPKLPHVQDDEALQATVRTEIVMKAEGMFLLASLKLWELEHDVTSKAAVREVLASIPTSLDKVYHQIFERIRAQGDRKKELAHQAIMWMYTQSDLHFRLNDLELRHLLACNISTSEPEFQKDRMPSLHDIITACGGLLKVESRTLGWNPGWPPEYPSFIHYSAYEYISHFPDSVKLPKDHYEVAFNICTIALRHFPVREVWLKLAHYMDSYRPAVVESALGDPDFKGQLPFKLGSLEFSERPPWLEGLLIESSNGKPNSLVYAAALGLPGTFRRARETRAPDEHEFRQVMEILVICRHWDLVHELWEDGEFDPNVYWENIGTTAACHLVDTTSSGKYSVQSLIFLKKFLYHPSTSLCCPRHGDMLICAIGSCHNGYDLRPNFGGIFIILERLYRDSKDGSSPPGRISVYPPPNRTRSHPPDILDVIAVFLQRAEIDLDAQITQMVPPEILLTLLMLPWHDHQYIQSFQDLLRPYARRPVDIPDASTSNHVRDADALADNVVPDTAQAVEALDVCATAEPDPTDNIPAHGDVLDNLVPNTARTVDAVDTYRRYRMTVVHLLVGAAISLFIYLCYLMY